MLRLASDRVLARFWAKVDKNGPIHETLGTPCWLWTASKKRPWMYGQFGLSAGNVVYAHRFAYEVSVGSIIRGLEVDHLCRVTWCVNPRHLEAVTSQVNSHRSMSVSGINSRKTHCVHGHAFSEENTRRNSYGRKCRRCHREGEARRRRLRAMA